MDGELMDSKVKEALELFESAKTGWNSIYEDAKNDLKFYGGDQWEPKDISGRMASKRPTITLNKLPQFVHQIVNDIRQNVPSIKVLPMGDGADVGVAKTIQGLIKNIEYVSKAAHAYDMAAECQIKCSLGFIRVDHGYSGADTFEQDILIKRVVNPLAVMIDPNSVEADGSDAMYGFVNETMEMRNYEALYPNASKTDFLNPSSNKDLKAQVINIAEFFNIVQDELEVALVEGGHVLTLEDAKKLGVNITQTRKIKKNRVVRCKMNGDEILEETRFPGSYVPLVPVYGEEHWTDGKRNIYSLVRFAKDAQRMHNYWASLETEVISKAPQAPFMAAEGQLEGYENEWSNPALAQVLHYHTKDIDGQVVGPPQRLAPPPVPSGIVNARASTEMDMKAIMGIYDASLGQHSNERTGVAIQAKQREGDQGSMHFMDNLNRSIEHVGRVILSMIPEVYDTPRIIRIMTDEDGPDMVGVNGEVTGSQVETHDLTIGKYDVAVKAGPSYATRRLEIQNMMSNIMQTNPQLVSVMGDLFFKYSDMPGADVIAARLKKTIPPQLLQGEDDKNANQIPPEVQQKMQQMAEAIQQDSQVIQQGAQELQRLQKELQDKQADQQIKLQSDQLKAEVEKLKIALEEKKLGLDHKKLEIEHLNTAIEAHKATSSSAQSVPAQRSEPTTGDQMAPAIDDHINELHGKLQQAMQEKQNQEARIQQESEKTQLMQQQQMAQEEQERQERKAQADALLHGLAAIQHTVGALVDAINKPKTIVRNPDGTVKGVQ